MHFSSKLLVYSFIGIVTVAFIISTIVLSVKLSKETNRSETRNYSAMCYPLVIAHRGASGYVPEHTLGAYALAVTMGADFIEPDLVMTKDSQLISRHDNELGLTTDVAEHPEFASRNRSQYIDGTLVTGWFTEDFTLAEIKTLSAIERIPLIRPGNARMDYTYEVPTFQEILDLVKTMQDINNRTIGIYPEIKHSSHFQQIGLPMESLVVETLHKNGYTESDSPVFIQSFEVNDLKKLKNITKLPLLQLYSSTPSLQPYDQYLDNSTLTYAMMATAAGLIDVAKYANAVGPDKSYIIPRTSENNLGNVTSFVRDAHAAGLEVHPYTFRAENEFLPQEFRSSGNNSDIGDFASEIEVFLATSIDGLFSDQPDVPYRVRGKCNLVTISGN